MSKVEAAGNNQVPSFHIYASSRASSRVERVAQHTADTVQTASVQIATASTHQHRVFARLQSIDERQNQEAIRIRDEDQRMEKTGQLLTQMKREIYRIIKNYPPYPLGEPERVKFLRSFNGLRQQIESLVFPPDEKWMGRMPGQAAFDQASTVSSPAPQNIQVPTLPDMADDSAVAAAAAQTDAAAVAVTARRQEIAREAADVEETEGSSVRARELQQQNARMVLERISEDEAEARSAAARQELARTSESGMTMEQDLLLLAVG
jgi:hypothetical protein